MNKWQQKLKQGAAQETSNVGKTFPTRLGPNWTGRATVIAHDAAANLYQTPSKLWWKLVDGELVAP